MAWIVLILSFLICLVSGKYNGGIITLAQQVKSLDVELRQLKIDFPRLEDKLFNSMELSQLDFRYDMRQYIVPELIHAHVRDVLMDLLRDNSLNNMINSHVTSEIKHLKMRYNFLKIQHQQMSREVSHIKRDRAMVTSRLVRKFATKIEHLEGINKRLNHSVNITMEKVKELKRDNTKLKKRYDKLQNSLNHVQTEVNTMEETCHCKQNVNMSKRINQLEIHQNVFEKEFTILQRKHSLNHNDSCTSSQIMSTPSPSQPVRSRVLIVSFRSGAPSHQLSIDGNTISVYPHLTSTAIEAVAYDPTKNVILFSRSKPKGIYSITLEGRHVSTLRRNVASFGIAVDEDRDMVVLTTYNPKYSVSKMTTEGRNFIPIIDLSQHGRYPIGVALDPRKRMVYFTNHVKLMSMTYDGLNLKVLNRGYIRGVALDLERGFLYYHILRKIMRRSLSGGSDVMIEEMNSNPINMRYYNNTVFIASNNDGIIYAVYRHLNNDFVMKLGEVGNSSLICLIP